MSQPICQFTCLTRRAWRLVRTSKQDIKRTCHCIASFYIFFSSRPRLRPPCTPDLIMSMHRIFGIEYLLDEIFSWISLHEHTVVARVSRNWFRLAVPAIWLDVVIVDTFLLLKELRPTCIKMSRELRGMKIENEPADHVRHFPLLQSYIVWYVLFRRLLKNWHLWRIGIAFLHMPLTCERSWYTLIKLTLSNTCLARALKRLSTYSPTASWSLVSWTSVRGLPFSPNWYLQASDVCVCFLANLRWPPLTFCMMSWLCDFPTSIH